MFAELNESITNLDEILDRLDFTDLEDEWEKGDSYLTYLMNGRECWKITKSELLFEFVTKDWETGS
jgi:hypothetical protein